MLRGASLHFRLRAKTAVVYLLRNRSTAHSDICCFCKLMLDVRCHRQKLTWIYWFFVDFAFQKCWPFQCITLIDLFEACHIPSHTHTPMRRVREAKQLQSIHTSCPYHYDAISQGTYKACLKRDISMMICHYIYIFIILLSSCHFTHLYCPLFLTSKLPWLHFFFSAIAEATTAFWSSARSSGWHG